MLVVIHVFQPFIGCFFIVTPVPAPLTQQCQVLLEMQWQVITRHHAATEKVPAHPVCRIIFLEGIRQVAVAKDMHEKTATRFQPVIDAAKQVLVVAHVFKHFHRDDAVVCFRADKVVHVTGVYANIVEFLLVCQLLDVFALRM